MAPEPTDLMGHPGAKPKDIVDSPGVSAIDRTTASGTEDSELQRTH